jgi:pimeloyl-ACP methyl ester carboxylesterase
VIASGDPNAPALILFHGGLMNSVTWMGDVATWAKRFRVYAVDMIGEPGFSAASRPGLNSDAYTAWLDDVMAGLSVKRASLVGVSLGGWLALDYATRRPEFAERIALLCPGGVGPQKVAILFKLFALQLMGERGKRRAAEIVLGKAPVNPSPVIKAFGDFMALIRTHFIPRRTKLPVFSDDALQRLKMPLLAIVGGKDVLLDSRKTQERLRRNVSQAEVRLLPEAGHFIPRQTAVIEEFLLGGKLLHSKPGEE